jgi:hypothetical protein
MNQEDLNPPTLQGVMASLLWLAAHPDRRLCFFHQAQMLMQMRYLAEYPSEEVEPLLRSVAYQLAEELDASIRKQLAESEEHSLTDVPSSTSATSAWIN